MKINFKKSEENEKKRYETGKYIFKKPNKLSQKSNQKIWSQNTDQNKYGTLNLINKKPFF